MSLHQIIYTSCKRGINGVNDGQQVFSYDATFTEVNNDEVKSLFSYQPPTLEPGVIMTEEIARTLPRSFVYRRLSGGAGALALSTYLGRDYMGPAGRFGNHLSHVVIADEGEIRNYPCEFYGSSLLRDHMEFDEVNNPNRPDFLPVPVLERGYRVDIDGVIDFLGEGDRMETFKNMLHAVLAFESERKRVVICDEPENIVMWIAAIEYTLPLRSALGINFSTYDFDPSLSASQICGVIPTGSRYNAESQRLHFVFDLYRGSCAEFEKDEHYFDFIDTSMSFSYDSLQDFHRFLTGGYTYDKADEDMYAAYRLYLLMSDGIEGLSVGDIRSALDFAGRFARTGEQGRILDCLFRQKSSLTAAPLEAFLHVMDHIMERRSELSDTQLADIRTIMVDRVLYEFLNNQSGERAFVEFYDRIGTVCKESGFSVATELMRKHNRDKLFALLQNDIDTWKIAFIIRVVTTFAKDQNATVNDLLPETPLGQTYYGLVKAVYSRNAKNGFFLVTRVLEEFADNCVYLVNMALNLEGMLLDMPGGNQEAASMWKYFGQTMVKYHAGSFAAAWQILGSFQRYEQIYLLYTLAMTHAAGVEECRTIFSGHYKVFVLQDEAYRRDYGSRILDEYYRMLERSDGEAVYNAKIELFGILFDAKMDVPFAENLVKDIVKFIPFETPSRENGRLIQNAFEYLYNQLRRPVTGKLLLLVIAMVLEKCKKVSQLHDTFEKLERLTAHGKADMSRVTDRSAERYFSWLLPAVCDLCQRSGDLVSLYDLFAMPGDVEELFFTICADLYMKGSKGGKDTALMCEFLGFVFARGSARTRDAVGKALCKLNKQKLAALDETVKDRFLYDRDALAKWEEIQDALKSTNPFLSSLSNLFKRKKD